MSRIIIGIDTSCYTTSAAAVTQDGKILASCRKLLPVPAGSRGLRQSEMVFLHTKQLPEMIQELSKVCSGYQIAAVTASSRPRDDEQSYMPAFHVGDALAHSLSALLGVPYFATTHQRGHMMAATVESGLQGDNFIGIHLSGGTTELLQMRENRLALIGGTLDLHAGQVIDRTGVSLGLPFPAGPHLEEMAMSGQTSSRLKISLENDDLACHFSGLESQVQRWIQQDAQTPENIAAEVFDAIARTIARMAVASSQKSGLQQVLITGGVASSRLIRQLLIARIGKRNPDIKVLFGKHEYSGDNAVGVALIGADKFRKSIERAD